MTNKFLAALQDIAHVIEWPFVHIARAVSIVNVTMKDYPAVRTAVAGLLSEIETNVADTEAAIGAGGLNIAADVAELEAAKTLYAYIKGTFVPALEAAYKDEVTAATGAQEQAAAKAAAASAAALKAAKTRAANSAAPSTTAATSTDPASA